ncbi:hypothetical protein B0T18DRAFT_416371, partial [Schizothecium vesticola]
MLQSPWRIFRPEIGMSLLGFALGQLHSGICTWEKRRSKGGNAMLVFARMRFWSACLHMEVRGTYLKRNTELVLLDMPTL